MGTKGAHQPQSLNESPTRPPGSARPAFSEENTNCSPASSGRQDRTTGSALKLPPLSNLQARPRPTMCTNEITPVGTSPQNPFPSRSLIPSSSDSGSTDTQKNILDMGDVAKSIPGSASPTESAPPFRPAYRTSKANQGALILASQKQSVSVLVVTWNMANKCPPSDLSALLGWNGSQPPEVGNCDMIVVGVQEAHDLDKWEKSLVSGLMKSANSEFYHIQSVKLDPGGWIHMALFVSHSLLPCLRGVRKASISTGIGNVIGNKGGVGISLCVNGTTVAFVNCHFQAHQNAVEARNQDFHRIHTELFSTPSNESSGSNRVIPIESVSNADYNSLTEQFDAVVWLGDLNYRVESNRKAADFMIKEGMLEVMRANDQLLKEMQRGTVFRNYKEGVLNFPPTYKYDKNSETYDSSEKQRVPSWTDRILFSCQTSQNEDNPKTRIDLLKYGPVDSIKTSDHRPVAARLAIATLKQSHPQGSQALYADDGSRACAIQ